MRERHGRHRLDGVHGEFQNAEEINDSCTGSHSFGLPNRMSVDSAMTRAPSLPTCYPKRLVAPIAKTTVQTKKGPPQSGWSETKKIVTAGTHHHRIRLRS